MNAHQEPQRFGRYVLLDKMGAGGMAEVFRAVVPGVEGFRRDLVVKRIVSDRARAANFIEMFVHEARISALLHHPNVVQVFDFGQVDGSYFLAMELLRGRDLLAVFRSLRERQRSLPLPIAAHVAHQVALGLGYAHGLTSPDGQPLNIVHRDVSPSNIMLLRTGGVKLLDFGIAQAIGEMDSEESDRNSFKGKLCYMAPERLRDEAQDGRVDLFALGAVLWEMLAGRRLFHGKTDVEKLRSVLDKEIPLPSSLRPDVPPALDAIVMKLLARDPDQRYPTGQALADELEDVVGELKFQSRMLPTLLNELFGSAPSSAHIALSRLSPELLACEGTITPAATPAISAHTVSSDTVSTGPAAGPGRRWLQQLRGISKRAKIALAVGAVIWAGMLVMLIKPPTTEQTPDLGQRFPPASVLSGSGHAGLGSTNSSGALKALGNPGIAAEAAPASPPLSAEATGAALGTVTAAPTVVSATSATAEISPSLPAGSTRRPVAVKDSAAATVRRTTRPRAVAAKPASGRIAAGRITRGLSIDPFAEAAVRGPKK